MFKVRFVNFGYYSAQTGQTLDEAKKIARRAGFQSAIETEEGSVVASYCPVAGFRSW